MAVHPARLVGRQVRAAGGLDAGRAIPLPAMMVGIRRVAMT
jgi:hypothetical protein